MKKYLFFSMGVAVGVLATQAIKCGQEQPVSGLDKLWETIKGLKNEDLKQKAMEMFEQLKQGITNPLNVVRKKKATA